ncbi:hypothetical protein CVD28_02910 [Bacillus sp. M6-12]|uniref:preprotein translocase subunit SecA n=1 Tax=Bacillus sp. M6-12 TaxID=2054166 RepID=UPI000C767D00|nr:DEAD/DEAH box helicase [Bacillus sp. M6-12]PLS19382.1 hypothetical protein CVD28_02910 [Bacillus sp. M6-12]
MLFWKKKEEIEKVPYKKEIEKIHEAHESISHMTQEELISYTAEVREESNKDKQKIKAYAIAHEVVKRTLGVTPYDVQLAGGFALSEGNISQMRTGEGKTITALFPAFWGYMANLQTYVITVNEYLVERDYEQAKAVFDYLNIEVGLILKDMDTLEKQNNYKKPIVYITNSEFAFDYLRDNIAQTKEFFMQGKFDFAIIDEADLVLVDEAKNPVIISSSSSENVPHMLKAKEFVEALEEGDYEIDDEVFIPYLTEQGFDKAKEYFGFELIENHTLFHAVKQSMMAYFKFKADVDYIVRDGEVHIVDKFTGRVLSGRRFQQGLHQAIEAKEGVEILPENVAVAMVTYQNLFRKFALLSGMTGTGIESKKEFNEIYNMDVKVIPTNRPVARIDQNDVMFQTKKDKYAHLLQLVKEKHEKGQPILIGTISVKESEEVSEILTKANIPFQLLNAKNDKEENEIVAKAGEKGAITIATNMAGRGTDIKLTEEVETLGGLFVLGVSRNESKRIDRQLMGRSGRQGQAGESQFLTSIEDEFLVMYPTNKFEKFVKKNKEYPATKETVTTMVDEIQDVMDSQGVSVRKFQFQMDEILHYQREYVYNIRRGILTNGLTMDSVREKISEMVTGLLKAYREVSNHVSDWDRETLKEDLKKKFGIELAVSKEELGEMDYKEYKALVEKELSQFLEKLEEKIEKGEIDQLLYETSLEVIDGGWMTFLESLEEYKQGFGLMAQGEQDPIRKFSMDVDSIFKDIMAESYQKFFSNITKRGDVLLTVATHGFFTVFPMKSSYLFKFNLKSEEQKQVKSVLYSERSIVEEFNLSGTTDVVIVIPYMLNPGKYVIKNFVDGKEINRIGFKVIAEGVEDITDDAPALTFRLPVEEMQQVEESMYRATLTHVITKNTFEFEVPTNNEWLNIEKPEGQNWMLGRYVITIFGSNLPLYHKEYVVYPKQLNEEEVAE